MERKLATIRKIDLIEPIEGADAIELATIGGWKVVVKKNEFKTNDLCVYFEIDSVLFDHPEFSFLSKYNFRIKTVKLRGQISQGICFPISLVTKFGYANFDNDEFAILKTAANGVDEIFYIFEGSDVSDLIGVKKYEPPVPANLRGKIRGGFPGQVPKTDEERCQNLKSEIEKWKEQNLEFVITEKLDGSSSTFIMINDEFHVCSRNLDLIESQDNTFWQLANKYDLKNKMIGLNIALQGELVGPGIQKNKYQLKQHDIYFFNAFDIDKQKYLSWEEFKNLISKFNLNIVPIINESFKLNNFEIKDLLLLAEDFSKLNSNQQREGIVFKTKSDTGVNHGKISFKAISNKFLLKHED